MKLITPVINAVINIIINKLIARNKPLIIILWGNPANDIEQFSFEKENDYKNRNIYILRSSHPSNMGNAKNTPLKDGKIPSFMSSNNFFKANEILKSCGEKEINWTT
jgi:uracil DNA glycosylase